MEKKIFKVGDRVYYPLIGWGICVPVNDIKYNYLIAVNFDNTTRMEFTKEGKLFGKDLIPSLSFTEYDFVNGGFSQDRGDRIVFTNNIGEDFTEKELETEHYFFADKFMHEIHRLYWSHRIDGINILKEDKHTSEIFRTREAAEKWLAEYKKKQLKLEEVYYVADSNTKKLEILNLLKSSYISSHFILNDGFNAICCYSDSIIDRSENHIKCIKTEVDKETFIKILKENNLLKENNSN